MSDDQCNSLMVRVTELEKRLELHNSYQQRAVDKAHLELRERLAGMNEFREQLKDQAGRFPTREEIQGVLSSVRKDLDSVHDIVMNWQGRFWMVAFLLPLVGGGCGALLVWLMK